MHKSRLPFLIISLCLLLIAAALAGLYFYKRPPRPTPSRTVEAIPDTAGSHYVKGMQYYYKKEYDKAISEFKKSIRTKPTAQTYCELAVSYMEKEDFKTAIENLKTSIKLNPEYPKSEYAIAVCYARITPPDTKLAREHFERAKKLGYHAPEWFERFLTKLEREE